MTDQEIAETIVEQLGGRHMIAMTGARFLTQPLGILIGISHSPKGVNRVKITLNGADLYDLEFLKVRRSPTTHLFVTTTLATFEDVYCDQLQDLFEEATGLLVSLFPRH